MTDYIRDQLRAVGWKDGDPLPGNFHQMVQDLVKEVENDREQAAGTIASHALKKDKIGGFVDITKLPKEKQDELKQYLKEHKQQVEQEARVVAAQKAEQDQYDAEVASGAVPASVADAMQVMGQAVQPGGPEAVIRQSAPKPPGPKIPEGKQFAGNIGAPIMTAPPPIISGSPPQSPTPPADDQPASPGGDTPPPTHCPRCLWPTGQPFDVAPTREEIDAFAIASWGVHIFKRAYEVAGKMRITLRGLTTRETIEVNKQLGYEVRQGKIVGDAEYFHALMEYRLALSVAKIEGGGHVLCEPPGLAAYKERLGAKLSEIEKEGARTVLPAMRDEFYDTYIPTESLQHMVRHLHRQFQRLTEALEVKMCDPDFCKGIGLSA